MGLGFLVPAFLAGLAAIGIPVVIHLLNRERKDVVRFPSLMFLERIPYRAIRRQRIRHPWLLLLRILALALITLAFARPFLSRTAPATASASGREVVVLLDRSSSMGYGDRWSRALAAARRELAAAGPNDRVSLVAFDEEAVTLVEPGTAEGRAEATLAGLRPSPRMTRLAPALSAAREILSGSSRPAREVVLISDLQRSAWDGGSEGRLPANVTSRIVSVADSGFENRMVSGVDLVRDPGGARSSVSIVARLVNQGSRAATGQPVILALQGREIERRTVDIPARGAATVRFASVPVPANAIEASVSLPADPLPGDDVYYFTLSRGQVLPVLILEGCRVQGAECRAAAPRRSLYLERALALGSQPPFITTHRGTAGLDAAALRDYPVIILNNIPFPSGTAGVALENRVRSGAGLIAVLGDNNDPRRWPGSAADLLPVTGGAVADIETARLGTLTRGHPVFALFQAARSGDFTGALFQRTRALTLADSAHGIAWYDDGNVALAELAVGKGRVLAWGSTLDDYWNDLVVQPVWVPFIHSLVRYAAGYTPEPVARTVGQRLARSSLADSTAARTVVAPDGARHRLADSSGLEVDQPGVYRILGEDGVAPLGLVAVNVDRREAQPEHWDSEELQQAITAPDDSLAIADAGAELTPEKRERNQRGWWLLLAAGALTLLCETGLANRTRSEWRGARSGT